MGLAGCGVIGKGRCQFSTSTRFERHLPKTSINNNNNSNDNQIIIIIIMIILSWLIINVNSANNVNVNNNKKYELVLMTNKEPHPLLARTNAPYTQISGQDFVSVRDLAPPPRILRRKRSTRLPPSNSVEQTTRNSHMKYDTAQYNIRQYNVR